MENLSCSTVSDEILPRTRAPKQLWIDGELGNSIQINNILQIVKQVILSDWLCRRLVTMIMILTST